LLVFVLVSLIGFVSSIDNKVLEFDFESYNSTHIFNSIEGETNATINGNLIINSSDLPIKNFSSFNLSDSTFLELEPFNITQNFTISFWFKLASVGSMALVSFGNGTINGLLIQAKGSELAMGLKTSTGWISTVYSFNDTLFWHNYVSTYDGTNIIQYLDRKKISQASHSGEFIGDDVAGANYYLGKWKDTSRYYSGNMDNFNMWVDSFDDNSCKINEVCNSSFLNSLYFFYSDDIEIHSKDVITSNKKINVSFSYGDNSNFLNCSLYFDKAFYDARSLTFNNEISDYILISDSLNYSLGMNYNISNLSLRSVSNTEYSPLHMSTAIDGFYYSPMSLGDYHLIKADISSGKIVDVINISGGSESPPIKIGDFIYLVTQYGGGYVYKINYSSFEIDRIVNLSVNLGSLVETWAYDDEFLYVPDASYIYKIRQDNLSIVTNYSGTGFRGCLLVEDLLYVQDGQNNLKIIYKENMSERNSVDLNLNTNYGYNVPVYDSVNDWLIISELDATRENGAIEIFYKENMTKVWGVNYSGWGPAQTPLYNPKKGLLFFSIINISNYAQKGLFKALNISNGNEVWSTTISNASGWGGMIGDGNYLYHGTKKDENGFKFVIINQSTGDILHMESMVNSKQCNTPVIYKGKVIISTVVGFEIFEVGAGVNENFNSYRANVYNTGILDQIGYYNSFNRGGSFELDELDYGEYNYRVKCEREGFSIFSTEFYSYNIDPYYPGPNITINSPSSSTYLSSSILLNITAQDNNEVGICWYSLDSGTTNQTLTQDGTTDFYNYTQISISSGNYVALFWCNDSAGNLNNTQNVSFTVAIPTEEETTTSGGISTYSPSSEQLEEGYSKLLRKTQKVKFTINEQTHTAVINSVNVINKKVEVEIEGEGILVELSEGSVGKIDLDNDGYYDLQISVNEVRINGYADLEFKEIHEEIPAEEKEEQESPSKTEEKIKLWMWISGGIILLIVVGIVIRRLLKNLINFKQKYL